MQDVGDDAVSRAAPSHADLAQAIDDHFRMQVVAFGHIAPNGGVHVSDHAVLAHCGHPSIFNRATALDFEQPDVTLSEVEHFFGSLAHSLWLESSTVDDDVDELLRGRGYMPMTPQAGMARPIWPQAFEHIRGGVEDPTVAHAELLTDPALAPQLADIAATGFGFGADDRLVFEDLARNALRLAKPFDHGATYAVRAGDHYAATGILLCTAHTAGVTALASAPGHRRAGHATTLITRALHDGATQGCSIATNVANPELRELLLRLDFRDVSSYCIYRQAAR